MGAHAAVREEVWARRAPDGASVAVVLDIDATLVEIHSEHKAGAAAHFKGGYGFHPLVCFSSDGDALTVVLRPGNAAANNIDDHIDLLDAAIGRLPAAVYVGHRAGDDADLATRPVVLRADSAGCSTKIAEACRDRNVGYSRAPRPQRAPHNRPPTRQPPHHTTPHPHRRPHRRLPPTPQEKATKTPQPPPQTTRRANHTRPHTGHNPQTTRHRTPNPQSNTPPTPNTPPKDPNKNQTTPQTILMNNQG